MSAGLRFTNLLLLVIAICLVLITIQMYNVNLVASAHADPIPTVLDVRVVNPSLDVRVASASQGMENALPVQVMYRDSMGYLRPVVVNDQGLPVVRTKSD